MEIDFANVRLYTTIAFELMSTLSHQSLFIKFLNPHKFHKEYPNEQILLCIVIFLKFLIRINKNLVSLQA